MNLDKLLAWSTSIILGFAAVGQLDTLQMSIWKAQAHVLYASRTSTWGSPRFFPDGQSTSARRSSRVYKDPKFNRRLMTTETTQGGALCKKK